MCSQVNVLFDLFRFMKREAFDKHCEELLTLIKQNQAVVKQAHQNAATASSSTL
jgi:hypothetical protein